jgi:hypothetical protein
VVLVATCGSTRHEALEASLARGFRRRLQSTAAPRLRKPPSIT